MGLETVHYAVVCFNAVDRLCGRAIPHQHMTALRTAHHVVLTPETRVLDLRRQESHMPDTAKPQLGNLMVSFFRFFTRIPD